MTTPRHQDVPGRAVGVSRCNLLLSPPPTHATGKYFLAAIEKVIKGNL